MAEDKENLTLDDLMYEYDKLRKKYDLLSSDYDDLEEERDAFLGERDAFLEDIEEVRRTNDELALMYQEQRDEVRKLQAELRNYQGQLPKPVPIPRNATTNYRIVLENLRARFIQEDTISEQVLLSRDDFDTIAETLCVEV